MQERCSFRGSLGTFSIQSIPSHRALPGCPLPSPAAVHAASKHAWRQGLHAHRTAEPSSRCFRAGTAAPAAPPRPPAWKEEGCRKCSCKALSHPKQGLLPGPCPLPSCPPGTRCLQCCSRPCVHGSAPGTAAGQWCPPRTSRPPAARSAGSPACSRSQQNWREPGREERG